ncbi:hypothetical protein RNZ50_20160 [Paracoccaceae bacterium Fryx2]|nr:hypothetical protein [Paracoccaceae bacterium Fryx2]
MLSKIVLLFLLGMAVLAMFGRLRFPDSLKRRLPGRAARPVTCKKCGRFQIGKGACACETKKG